ncbi:MAG: LytTR family DNA-binding domain-containing protein [Mariniphaga sp.]|nr:LytTR family DNA-binding domain-containing protein [Mariniphaga sp.]MDD4225110.1 LytTR family DNA-binding domain-containing protein [Mariniphaga sp.]MDD4424434.1 LytTR family DNA-binding domain-containing protein [Mariniphaga sp.]
MNRNTNIILIEDEPYNLRLLENMIKKLRPGWEVVQSFQSVQSSVDWLQNNPHPDLIFMDIQLADGLCFSIFEQVEVKSMVIFTTAYDNYAIRAFKVNSIDYLLKPFKEKELQLAIEKFEHFRKRAIQEETPTDYSEILDAIRSGEKKYRKRFLLSKGAFYFMLPVEEIAFFLSESRMTTAVTFNDQNHVIDFPLDTLEEQLDPETFYRANRQIILNINSIKKIENYFGGKLKVRLILSVDWEVMVSRQKATDFKNWLGK